jgi:hypothetical protein
MAATFILGRNAKLYYSTTLLDGTNQVAVLTGAIEGSNVIDLQMDVESEFVDVTTRAEASQGFASQVAVLKNGQITFEARWKPGDGFFDALIDVWEGTTAEIAIIALDQDKGTTGAQGLMANMTVGFSINQNLRDIQKVNITLGISSEPEWYVVP